MHPISFETDPSRYRHWKLELRDDVAVLRMTLDEGGLTEFVACVVCAPGDADALRERIERACVDGLPRFKRPKRVAFLESLLCTATGKVKRFALHQRIGVRPPHGVP